MSAALAASSPQPIRVVVLADQPLLAEGLRDLLERSEDVQVVWSGTQSADAAPYLDDIRTQLVLGIGASLPYASQRLLDRMAIAHARMRQTPPAVCVIPSDVEFEDLLLPYSQRIAIVTADASTEELLEAVRFAQDGRRSVGRPRPRLRQLRVAPPAVVLTERERDILQLLALGLSTSEITDRLGVSANTVRTHVRHLLGKLGAHNRLEATAIASHLGLLRFDNGHI